MVSHPSLSSQHPKLQQPLWLPVVPWMLAEIRHCRTSIDIHPRGGGETERGRRGREGGGRMPAFCVWEGGGVQDWRGGGYKGGACGVCGGVILWSLAKTPCSPGTSIAIQSASGGQSISSIPLDSLESLRTAVFLVPGGRIRSSLKIERPYSPLNLDDPSFSCDLMRLVAGIGEVAGGGVTGD